MRAIGHGDASMALVLGAVVASQAGSLLYHRRERNRAPFAVKAAAGAVTAAAAAAMGLVIHRFWTPMTYPEVVIPIAAIGSFVFPFVLFETMRKALVRER